MGAQFQAEISSVKDRGRRHHRDANHVHTGLLDQAYQLPGAEFRWSTLRLEPFLLQQLGEHRASKFVSLGPGRQTVSAERRRGRFYIHEGLVRVRRGWKGR